MPVRRSGQEKMMAAEFPPPGFDAVMVFDDKTPNNVILNRIVANSFSLAAHTDLSNEEGNDLRDLVILIARKMLSVWNRLQAYEDEERRLTAQFTARADSQREHSQALYDEFDVFTVQIKSALDHVVQVMRPILGRTWNMYTFEKKGQGVLKALQNNTGKRYVKHVELMEAVLFSEVNREWLTMIIVVRDRVNHGLAGGLTIERFAVFRNADGTVGLPTWTAQQTLRDAMNIVWENFFRFVEDFLTLAINFRLREGLSVTKIVDRSINSPQPSWGLTKRQAADPSIEDKPTAGS